MLIGRSRPPVTHLLRHMPQLSSLSHLSHVTCHLCLSLSTCDDNTTHASFFTGCVLWKRRKSVLYLRTSRQRGPGIKWVCVILRMWARKNRFLLSGETVHLCKLLWTTQSWWKIPCTGFRRRPTRTLKHMQSLESTAYMLHNVHWKR